MPYYIAIDIGGTQMRVARFREGDLEPVEFIRGRTQQDGLFPQDNLVSLIKSVWPSDEKVYGIGIASPGPIDMNKGVIITAPNIPQWNHFPVVNYLTERFQVPVYLDNDANLAALGEWKYGAGRGHHNLVYITVSTGIGGGIIIDDRLLHGERGLAAELGHITVDPSGPRCGCGQYGHLESFASGTAIARNAKEAISKGVETILPKDQNITAKTVAEAAVSGDDLSQKIFTEAGTYLGRAFADYLHIFNPSILIIGGGVALCGDLILTPIKEAIQKYVISAEYLQDLVIAVAELGDEPGLKGALAMVESNIHS
jgi:glucokinase